MAADTPYVGTEAAETLASHIQKRLLVADTMPASPAEGQVVLYAGATTASFTQGGIYLYDGEAWNLISAADIDLSSYKKQYNMTQAEWDALTTAEKVALAGQNVVIKDDGSDVPTVETIETSQVSLRIIKQGRVVTFTGYFEVSVAVGNDIFIPISSKYFPIDTCICGFIHKHTGSLASTPPAVISTVGVTDGTLAMYSYYEIPAGATICGTYISAS